MSHPYLFVSDRCPHSTQILETLRGLNKIALYKVVSVESLNQTQLRSMPFLKKVPTLYHPETKDVVVGKDIFGYIAKPTNSRTERPVKEAGAAAGASPSAPAGGGGDVSAWGFEGTHSLSESYSDWASPNQFTNQGNSMYTMWDTSTSVQAPPAPTTQNTMQQKGGGGTDISARLEAMQAQRKNEFAGIQRQ
jgi:hypothetical protein